MNLNGHSKPPEDRVPASVRVGGKAALSPAILPTGIRPVEQKDLRRVWDARVREEVEKIIERDPELAVFIPEEVFSLLYRGAANSKLYLVYVDNQWVGFGIVQVREKDFSREKYLLSWIGAGWHPKAVPTYFASLDNLARQMGIKTLRFETSRGGWVRRLRGTGWHVLGFAMEKTV